MVPAEYDHLHKDYIHRKKKSFRHLQLCIFNSLQKQRCMTTYKHCIL